ncbi:MAG: sigma-70 family RNA polymerase sigma factor, partial [Bacteroidetes bacterium]|nr:sigma-70 family RNA polymerase sigma factor [Bacteroidota bacterium]
MEQTEDKQLEQIYRETFPIVAGLVKKMGGDLSTAKDIFHDALIIYLERSRLNTLHIRTSPQNYILGIARILWKRKFNDELKYAVLDDTDYE